MRTRIISVSSGKGGVGKTTIVTNLAQEFASQGARVLIFDGDIGMANVDVMYGIRSEHNILDLVFGRNTWEEVICQLAPRIDLLPGGTGINDVYRLSPFEKRAMLDLFDNVSNKYDIILIDTASGLSDHVLYLNAAADETLIVVTPDPSSVTDAYALIKVMNQQHRVKDFSILCNQTKDEEAGLQLYARFSEVVDRFLSVRLSYQGAVPYDAWVRKSQTQQRTMVDQYPYALASVALKQLAVRMNSYSAGGSSSLQNVQSRGLRFFWQQVLGETVSVVGG